MPSPLKLRFKKLKEGVKIPSRATPGSTGLDIYAFIEGGRSIQLSTVPRLIGTGLAVEIPKGYDLQVRPRSGLSARGVVTTFGTIDSDYRGEVMVTMYLTSPSIAFEVKHGDRIAQMVVTRLVDVAVEESDKLTDTGRGDGGHGSTGR